MRLFVKEIFVAHSKTTSKVPVSPGFSKQTTNYAALALATILLRRTRTVVQIGRSGLAGISF